MHCDPSFLHRDDVDLIVSCPHLRPLPITLYALQDHWLLIHADLAARSLTLYDSLPHSMGGTSSIEQHFIMTSILRCAECLQLLVARSVPCFKFTFPCCLDVCLQISRRVLAAIPSKV
jgi:hypothetical protein